MPGITRAPAGPVHLFSVGERAWHRDGQLSATVLECDRDRFFFCGTTESSSIFGRGPGCDAGGRREGLGS
jgi:hypothetical protein